MSARNNSPRPPPRGPRATRRGAARADRDGDLPMGIAVKGRGGIGKPTTPARPGRDLTAKATRGTLLSATAQRQILKHAAAVDVSMKEARPIAARGGVVELKVTGWTKSKASDSADGGVSALVRWLEKKASTRLGSRSRSVRVKQTHRDGDVLLISVASEDLPAMLRMNGYNWAGINIAIEEVGGSGSASKALTSESEKLKVTLRGVLERRYNFETKFLDLSAIGQDEELKNQKIFDKKSTASKFFPAMMVVLARSFDKPEDLNAAVTSVSLANNDLEDVEVVTDLAHTLPRLLNLDLSNNKIASINAMMRWRRKFYHLQHLVLTGNPIQQTEPTYTAEMPKWYPNLRLLNGIQVRTEEEIAKKANITDLPFPILTARFQDENGICEGFVRNFVAGFDTDRAALAAMYYDARSQFSYAVNTQAPRDPTTTQQTEKQDWEAFIKGSRNLKKIQHLPARQQRQHSGTKAITDAFFSLPKTRHPDLASEARKWMIEAHIQPGVPDTSGNSPNGVDGFKVDIHGEFAELDTATGQPKKMRSFDRTFVLGPGGPQGVRVVTDMLTVRAYGGSHAFEPDALGGWNTEAPAVQAAINDAAPDLPAGITLQIADQMVAELSKQTGMTAQYAKECLDQVAWNFEEAMAAFGRVKASLPADAFVRSV